MNGLFDPKDVIVGAIVFFIIVIMTAIFLF